MTITPDETKHGYTGVPSTEEMRERISEVDHLTRDLLYRLRRIDHLNKLVHDGHPSPHIPRLILTQMIAVERLKKELQAVVTSITANYHHGNAL